MNKGVEFWETCKSEMETHIKTLKESLSNPLLQQYYEENERYLKLALDGLTHIENELAHCKKTQ